ncbi:hypothetical protein D3Z52_14835 [Clostridiaceae bacterium]|nr:hypothetical protein [Clostridiaceae bacterium]
MALIIPEVFADAVNAKLNASLRIGRVAFNATPDVSEAMKYGDTIHFPKLNRVVTASEVTKGTPMTPAEVDMTDMSASIKQVGASARVYDKEAAQIKGRVMDEMVRQVADAMATKVDGDLVVAMDTDAVYKHASASATAITSSELDEAMNSFGDDVDTSKFAGIIINSRLRSSFMAMDAFTNVQKTFNLAEQANGIVTDGVIGYYAGIPVVLCDNGTYDATAKECKTYIVKRNSLGYVFQRNIAIEEEREAKLLATDIVAHSLYATKLLDTSGVVIIRKTIA